MPSIVEVSTPYCIVRIANTGVLTKFDDGTSAYIDIPRLDNGQWAVEADACGYGENWKLWLQHHVLGRSLLSGIIWGKPSPTLWALAHDQPMVDCSSQYETGLVNVALSVIINGGDYALADDVPHWKAALSTLRRTLHSVGMLPETAYRTG